MLWSYPPRFQVTLGTTASRKSRIKTIVALIQLLLTSMDYPSLTNKQLCLTDRLSIYCYCLCLSIEVLCIDWFADRVSLQLSYRSEEFPWEKSVFRRPNHQLEWVNWKTGLFSVRCWVLRHFMPLFLQEY